MGKNTPYEPKAYIQKKSHHPAPARPRRDGAFRRAEGEYLLDGHKLLREALDKGAELRCILWKETAQDWPGLENVPQYVAPADLFDYVSPMKNSPGPLFTAAIPAEETGPRFAQAILLENVQDPGNVGTLLRTAAAMGVKTVILCGACADVYSPKTARATMGAIFRETVLRVEPAAAKAPGGAKTACRSTARLCQSGPPISAPWISSARSLPSAARGGG